MGLKRTASDEEGGPCHEGAHPPGSALLAIVESAGIGTPHRYHGGETLFWQGDPVQSIFVVRKGAIREYAFSPEGKAYIYRILGPGDVAGAVAWLLGREHEEVGQALGDTDVIALPPRDFELLLSRDGRFSLLVMKDLARSTSLMESRARDLAFLDVQQRLLENLKELASMHGVESGNGIRIDLDITHQDIGEMVAANRCTITGLLNDLRARGVLWKDGHRLVIMSPAHIDILDKLRRAVVERHEWEARQWASEVVQSRVDPAHALETLAGAMREVERMFIQADIGLPEILCAAQVMKEAMSIIGPEAERAGRGARSVGTVVIGTVQGDVHDIGKNTVAMFLVARGFKVIDLGIDVAVSRFVEAVKTRKPDILALSALLTATIDGQRDVINALKAAGMRERVKVIIGGTPATPRYAHEIGADGYAPTAREAADLAWQLITS